MRMVKKLADIRNPIPQEELWGPNPYLLADSVYQEVEVADFSEWKTGEPVQWGLPTSENAFLLEADAPVEKTSKKRTAKNER